MRRFWSVSFSSMVYIIAGAGDVVIAVVPSFDMFAFY